ncbi:MULTISPECIES: response regulator [Thalassotalea]|uniref:response regulator n=1 Tax=Thalassotalea TaxID=1518149 RepID=UPI000944EEFB|nr:MULTISPECIES: response regulator [Thalassotalea]
MTQLMETAGKDFFVGYEELKVLIIDDNTLIHDTLKKTLYGLGIREVRCAQNAYYGMRLCNEMQFQIVVCAFNVNSDKDGFHLLEELKFKGHVTKRTVLIFLSTETSESLVNSIIELQPDDFWVKPLIPKVVKERLSNTLKIKSKLFNLYQAIDRREFSKVIYFADQHLKNKSLRHLHPNILRMRGEALLSLLEFHEAELFFQGLLKKYKFGWVYLGYVKSLLKQGRIDEIHELISSLTDKPETRFAMHDLLAQYHIEQEMYATAYEEIKKATLLSPRNIERNKKSWDLARLNHDHIGQFQATKSIVANAKNSIHDSPELLLNVIRAGIDLAITITDGSADKLLNQIERYIQQVQEDYKEASDFKEQIAVAQARLFKAQNEEKRAERIVEHKISLRPTPEIEDNLDKVKVFHELGMREEAMLLLEAIKNQISGESLTSQVVNRYIEQETKERADIHFTPKQLHDMAVEHYQKKRFSPALESVLQAIQLAPNSVKFSTSLLKIMVAMKETGELKEEDYPFADKAIKLFDNTKLEGKHAEVVAEVKENWQRFFRNPHAQEDVNIEEAG